MTAFGAIGQYPVAGSQPFSPLTIVTTLKTLAQALDAITIANKAQIGTTLPTLAGSGVVEVLDVSEFFDTSGHIELKVSSVAGLTAGQSVTIEGVTLEPLANGTWTISLPGGNFINLLGSPPPNTQGPTTAGTVRWGPGPSQTITAEEIEPATITTTLRALAQALNATEVVPAQINTTLRAFTQALDAAEIEPAQIETTLRSLSQALDVITADTALINTTLPSMNQTANAMVTGNTIVTTLRSLTQALNANEIEPAQIATTLLGLAQALDAIEIMPARISTTLSAPAQRLDAITIPPPNPVSITTTLFGLAQVLRARSFKVATGISVFGYAGDDEYGHTGGGSGYVD